MKSVVDFLKYDKPILSFNDWLAARFCCLGPMHYMLLVLRVLVSVR